MASKRTKTLLAIAGALAIGCGGGNGMTGGDGGVPLPVLSVGTIDDPAAAAADFSCMGSAVEPARGAEIPMTMNLLFFGEEAPARNVRVWFFRDNVVRDTCEAAFCQEQTSSADEGVLTFNADTNGWYAYRVFARPGPTSTTEVVDSVQFNEPAPAASGGVVEGNAVPRSTTDLIPAVLGYPRVPGTSLMAGTVIDCTGALVYGATVRLYRDGVLIEEGARDDQPHFRYFDGSDNPRPDSESVHTHVDGLYAAVNIPVDPNPEVRVRVEAWGRRSEGDAQPVRLGCEAIRVFADAVTIVNVGPERSDYPAGHPCAE